MHTPHYAETCEICQSTRDVHTVGAESKDGKEYYLIRLCDGCRVDDLMLDAFVERLRQKKKRK